MKRPDGVTLIAIWHFVVAVLFLVGLCAMTIPFAAILTGPGQDIAVPIFALTLATLAIIVFGIAFLVVGWGLWRLKSWARAGAIVLAVLQLPGFPIGTVIGALTLWYLLSDPDAQAAFQR